MTTSEQYRKMIKSFSSGQNEVALKIALDLKIQILPKAKMRDVLHVIAVLKTVKL